MKTSNWRPCDREQLAGLLKDEKLAKLTGKKLQRELKRRGLFARIVSSYLSRRA